MRVKVEMPEPTEAGVEVKAELRDDYQRQPSNDGYHYNDKKPTHIPDAPGLCQPPHQGFRPVGLSNSFGFPPFYGHHHPAMMPASFLAGRPSQDGPIGKIGDGHEQPTPHVDRHAYGRMPPIPNDGFLHEHHHRFDAGDFQHVNATGVPPYTGFRPSMRSPYANHQNNSVYNRSSHYHPARQRKWSSAAFRGLHPPMHVSLFSFFISLRLSNRKRNVFLFMKNI